MIFNKKGVDVNDKNRNLRTQLNEFLAPEDVKRLEKIRNAWDFYEGFHWEGMDDFDKPQITENYCRKFVDKFVAFELGDGFNISVPIEEDGDVETESPITDYLNEVWKYNTKLKVCTELGQSKSVTGDGWLQVGFIDKKDLVDPFNEFPKGKVKVSVLPTSIVFPEFDPHDKDILTRVTVAYPIEVEVQGLILKQKKKESKLYKIIWTNDTYEEYLDKELITSISNPYGIIPLVPIKNFPLVGRTEGVSDLEDIIPLNMELNLKNSDVSEIIDYHSAPVTIVYGAKVNALEKGANKVWGGLPTEARVENLQLESDLGASVGYISGLKKALHEVGCVPEGALGGEQAISNTSGIALQYVNMPLLERTKVKRVETKSGLELVNKLILLISVINGLFEIPEGIEPKDFYNNEVDFPDSLPKDRLIELQQIDQELKLGLESKIGAMRRLGKTNIKTTLEEIEQDRLQALAQNLEMMKLQGEIANANAPNTEDKKEDVKPINSGATNGSTKKEEIRKATTGQNGNQKGNIIEE